MTQTFDAFAGGWLLPLMVLIPLLCGIALAFVPAGRDELVRQVSLTVSGFVLMLGLVAALAFNWAAAAAPASIEGLFQLRMDVPWIDPLGIGLRFGVDSVSLWLILLTAFLMPLTILGTWNDTTARTREFYLWLLILEAALIGVFAATDLILFYIFFEMTLVPLFFLIGVFGSGNRVYAAAKFVIFTLTGSLFTFAGVIYVAWFHADLTGTWTFSIPALIEAAAEMNRTQQGWVLLALLAGFAVKVPMFPVHTWLPLAHTEAPTAGSVVLAGVLLKLGVYGLYRFALPMAPVAVVEWTPVIGVFAVIGIVYTALVCWVQTDVKKLVAYSSVSHMGFCILGLFALNATGVGGSMIHMLNHGLSTGALFLCVGMIYNRYHTREMADLSGLGRRMPIWSFFLVFFCFASVGLPGLNGFVGEILTLIGAFEARGLLGPVYVVFAALGLIFAAIYILYMVGLIVMGPVRLPAKYDAGVKDLSGREIAALAPIAVACLVLGLYPTPVLRSFEGSIDQTTAAARALLEPPALVEEEPPRRREHREDHTSRIPRATLKSLESSSGRIAADIAPPPGAPLEAMRGSSLHPAPILSHQGERSSSASPPVGSGLPSLLPLGDLRASVVNPDSPEAAR